MSRQSKRTSAPAPNVVPPLGSQQAPAPAIPSMFSPSTWCPSYPPQQPGAASSASCWLTGLQQLRTADLLSAQGSWWTPVSIGAPAAEDQDVPARGVDSHPPGGFLNFLTKNTPSHAQAVSNGSSSQPINVIDDTIVADCERTEKRLLWTKDEDCRLVGAWLNNSNDPIHANYKKNDQYWGEVAVAYNRATPKNRRRQVKHIKDRFGRIKKRVAWFCASWKEANALWASGESDVDLMDRALKSYEEEHKKDGPFMFKHCWDILRKEPKWDAYLERLDFLDPDKRKFNVEGDEGHHLSVDDDADERPIGGKKAKELMKRKRKRDQDCIIDLEDELQTFVEAQNKANEGRKEMLETQKLVSSENVEARKLAYLAAKENKESVMLETYRELLKQDTSLMSEDVRTEHVLALRCLREKIFGNAD